MAPRLPRQTNTGTTSAPLVTDDDYGSVPLDAEAIAAAADASGGQAAASALDPTQAPISTFGGGLGGIVPGAPIRTPGRGAPATYTYQQIVDAIRTSRDRQAITRMQRQLYDAGMYDDEVYKTPERGKFVPEPSWGFVDALTLDALNEGLGYASVRNLPLEAALAESQAVHQTDLARRRQAEEEAAKAGEKLYSPQVYFAQTATEQVPDADAVALTVDAVSRELLGREVTDEEKSRIVGSVMAQAQALAQAQGSVEAANARGIGEAQGLEYQMRVQAAQAEAAGTGAPGFQAPAGAQVIGEAGGGQTFITGGGVKVFEQVSPEAEAARQVEEAFASEAKQYALTRQFNTLLGMIGRAGAQG